MPFVFDYTANGTKKKGGSFRAWKVVSVRLYFLWNFIFCTKISVRQIRGLLTAENGKRRLSAASRFYSFIGLFPCYWALWSFFLFLEMPNTVRVPTPLMHRIASHKTELLSPVWGEPVLPGLVG